MCSCGAKQDIRPARQNRLGKKIVADPIADPIADPAARIRFYLHKEFRAAEIGFYLHKEFCAAEIWFYLHKEFLKKNQGKSMICLKIFRAARASLLRMFQEKSWRINDNHHMFKNFPRRARQLSRNFLRKINYMFKKFFALRAPICQEFIKIKVSLCCAYLLDMWYFQILYEWW